MYGKLKLFDFLTALTAAACFGLYLDSFLVFAGVFAAISILTPRNF